MMGEPMSRAASRAALTVLEFKSTREKKNILSEPRPQQSMLISEQRHSSVKPIKRDSSQENRSSSIDPLHLPPPSTEQIKKNLPGGSTVNSGNGELVGLSYPRHKPLVESEALS